MNRFCSLLMVVCLVGQLYAYGGENDSVPRKPPQAPNREQENWLFAAGSVVAATIAIVLVSLFPGQNPDTAK